MTDSTLITTQQAAPVAVPLVREAALPGFIVRKLFDAKAPAGRRTTIEACRAELAWSAIDFNRITDHRFMSHDCRYDGAVHPSEAYRMPHEQAAARVLNAWGHVHVAEQRIRELSLTRRSQIEAANDATQSNAYRNGWAVAAGHTVHELAEQLKRLRVTYPIFLKAIRAYREARNAITAPACLVRESNQPGL